MTSCGSSAYQIHYINWIFSGMALNFMSQQADLCKLLQCSFNYLDLCYCPTASYVRALYEIFLIV